MTDTNHHVLTGKVDITSNLLVGSSHLFVDTNNNRVGLITTNPDAGLHVNSNAYVNTDLRVGPAGVNQVVINATAGRIKAGSFEGDGSLLENVPAGADGAAATIAVGTTTPGPVGTTTASVTNSGTSSAAVFDFVIPRGDAGTNGTNGTNGDDGAAATIGNPTITTGLAGTEASVTNSGTSSAAVFDFVIPRGDQGTAGTNGTNGTNYFTLSGSNIYRTTGNVGIGTTEPETIFQIGSKAQTTGVNYLKIRGNNVSASALPDICGIIFNNSDIASLDGLRGESKIINERAGNNYGSALAFYTNPTDAGTGGTGVDSVKRMVIDENGNLRVGGDGMLTINERTNSGFDGTARDETIALQTTIDGRTLAQGAVYGHEQRVALALQPDFGYVGVGTVSPVTKLDVRGNIIGEGIAYNHKFYGGFSGNSTNSSTTYTDAESITYTPLDRDGAGFYIVCEAWFDWGAAGYFTDDFRVAIRNSGNTELDYMTPKFINQGGGGARYGHRNLLGYVTVNPGNANIQTFKLSHKRGGGDDANYVFKATLKFKVYQILI